jgi:hypothetical protein
LSPNRLSDAEFWNVQIFLLIVFVSESAFTIAAVKFGVKRLPFDPRKNIGAFVGENILLILAMPIFIHLLVLIFMFEHSGMGFSVGTGDGSGGMMGTP